MTNERTARLCGDPPYRADAYADDLAAIERIGADPDWRTGNSLTLMPPGKARTGNSLTLMPRTKRRMLDCAMEADDA